MRARIAVFVLAVAVSMAGSFAWAEWYKVTVTRKGKDVYRIDGTAVFIITKYCYEYAYSEGAVLKYDPASRYDNKIVFEHGECDVDKVVQ